MDPLTQNSRNTDFQRKLAYFDVSKHFRKIVRPVAHSQVLEVVVGVSGEAQIRPPKGKGHG